jgi:glycosyltransferase involved in cell wall biosynthesis
MKEGDAFIVQSEWLKEIFSENSVSNEIQVLRPSLGISLNYRNHVGSTISKNQICNPKKIIFFPSAFYPYKNHFFLLEVISLLANYFDFIFIVTFDRGQHVDFDRRVDELKIVDYVYYSGYLEHSEVLNFYKQCHCVVFPSEIESFGLPLLEASVIGSTIVALKLPYATDILQNYNGAFLLESLNVCDWFDAISQILCVDRKNHNYHLITSNNWNSILNRFNNVC